MAFIQHKDFKLSFDWVPYRRTLQYGPRKLTTPSRLISSAPPLQMGQKMGGKKFSKEAQIPALRAKGPASTSGTVVKFSGARSFQAPPLKLSWQLRQPYLVSIDPRPA